MQWHRDIYTITDDPERLDLDFVCRALHDCYWAAGRSPADIRASFGNSLAFALLSPTRPIGFARVITDRTTVSWICDVVIVPEFRGRGLGTWLLECIAQHPDVAPTVQHLNTRDALSFYARLGFVRGQVLTRWPAGAVHP